ncbi:prephenate dehydrogenase/arogenate dehydrogenase family protein [Desulfosarcina sp.]|uniref:prephenate dehydrogenase/arogenate dehydrogenase family protein n=1 Tax=Desulfosarcina sp. TaxID=2027861 RepID=UPI0035697438
MISIGIIGFGRFGKLTARYLSNDFSVAVSTRSDKQEAIKACGARPVSFESACRQRIVILCMPISAMRDTLRQAAPLLREDALVVDVCSVKVYPVQWMRELLPASVSILPTHPMFGPDSAARSLDGRKIVLCPDRIDRERYEKIRTWLESQGLVVITASPQEHDEKIAVSLSLTHFIGRSLSAFGARDLDIDTEGYKRLMHILGVVSHDTWQLFEDMHTYNPYAKQKRQAFIDAMTDIHERLNQ